MPDFFELAHRQRAHRFLEPDEVPDADIDKILDAAIRAPSGQNTQPWQFVVVQDAQVRRTIADATRDAWVGFAREYSRPEVDTYQWSDTDKWAMESLADAPVIIVVCGDAQAMDAGLLGSSIFPAAQNILLGALALGYGSLLSTLPTFAPVIGEALGLPAHLIPMAVIPIGRPARRLGPPRRVPFTDKTHRDRFGQPWAG